MEVRCKIDVRSVRMKIGQESYPVTVQTALIHGGNIVVIKNVTICYLIREVEI